MPGMTGWTEIGDRVFVRRYAFFDQNIGVVMAGDEIMVIDTRSSHVQGREARNYFDARRRRRVARSSTTFAS